MAAVPPVVAEHNAAFRVLRHYVWRLSTPYPKDEHSFYAHSFAWKFLESLQFPCSTCDGMQSYAASFLRPVTLPEALIHSDCIRTSDLATDLAIAGPDRAPHSALHRLCACVAIAIFLRKDDALFDRCFHSLPPNIQKAVKKWRLDILKRVRFYLQTRPDLDLIALARPTPRGNRATQHNSATQGFGANRFGVVGYSQLARELLLFMLLDGLLREGDAEPLGVETLDRAIACLDPYSGTDLPPALFDSVILPFFADLDRWHDRAGAASGYNVQLPQHAASGANGNTPSTPHLSKMASQLQAKKKEIEAKLANPGLDGAERAELEATLAKTRENLTEVNNQIMAARESRLLPGNDDEFRRHLELLLEFVQNAEASALEVVGSKGNRALFRDVLRLRFALALLSFRSETKLLAKDHIEELHAMFEPDEPIIGNALAFLHGNRPKEPWGEKREDGQHFYGVLEDLAHRLHPAPAPTTRVGEDVAMLLAEIEALLPPRLKACPTPSVDREGWEVELYLWAFGMEQALEHRGYAGAISSLGALREHVVEAILPAPERALRRCVELANQALPEGARLQSPGSAFRDRAGFLKAVKHAANQMNADALEPHGAIELLNKMLPKLLLMQAPDGLDELEPERRKAAESVLKSPEVAEALAADTRVTTSTPSQADAKFIYDFFTELYASTQPAAGQERWQYLAYRLVHDVKIDAYAEIYTRVLNHIAASLPHPLAELRDFYDEVEAAPGFSAAMDALRRLLGLPPQGGHHGP